MKRVFIFAVMCLCSMEPYAQTAFDRHFEDKSLRVVLP